MLTAIITTTRKCEGIQLSHSKCFHDNKCMCILRPRSRIPAFEYRNRRCGREYHSAAKANPARIMKERKKNNKQKFQMTDVNRSISFFLRKRLLVQWIKRWAFDIKVAGSIPFSRKNFDRVRSYVGDQSDVIRQDGGDWLGISQVGMEQTTVIGYEFHRLLWKRV